MNQLYKDAHHQADKLFYKYQDIVDDMQDGFANETKREIKEIVECIEMDRPPRFVEERIRHVEQLLEKVRAGQSHMMTPEDAAYLIREYEQLRVQLRRMPNY